jgi:protein O-mannosyl-transferase
MTRHLRWVPVAVALVFYAPSLGFDRTFDDDYHVPLPHETPHRSLTAVWQSRYWDAGQGGGLYRPVTSTTYWVEGKLHTPLALRHAVNGLLHAAVTGLVVKAALMLGAPVWAAALGGTLFAVHPTHVETVAGLVGRAELLAALFMLLALALHVTWLRGGVDRTQGMLVAGSIALFSFLAAGSKESAWFLPLFALPLHACLRSPLRMGWPAWLGYAVGVGGHMVLRHQVLGGWMNAPDVVIDVSDNPLVALHGLDRLFGGLRVVGANALHLVLPFRLSPDYSGTHLRVTGGLTDPYLILGVLFLSGCCGLLVWSLKSRESRWAPAGIVAGSWLVISALFFMNLYVNLGTVLADRLLFWPTIATSLLIATAVSSTPTSWGVGRHLPAGIALLFVAYYAATSWRYLPEWRNDLALFTPAVRTVPESPRVWYNYGRAVQDAGDLDHALAAFQRSRALAPTDYQSWAQEATVLLQRGEWENARAPLAEALRLYPEDAVSLINEGIIWMQEGDVERAAVRFREVLNTHPDRSEALLNLALAEGRLGHVDTAESLWRRYVAAKPDDPEGLNNLAWLLATERDRAGEAEPLARQAILLKPGDANLRDTLAEALLRQGKREAAAQVAREALALHPDAPLDSSLQRFLINRTGP